MLKLSGTAQLTRNSLLKIAVFILKMLRMYYLCICKVQSKVLRLLTQYVEFCENIFPHFEGSLLDLFSIWFWFLLFVAAVATCTHSKGARQRDRAGREGRVWLGRLGKHATCTFTYGHCYDLCGKNISGAFPARDLFAFCCALLCLLQSAVCWKYEQSKGEREKGERMADWALFKP